MTNDKEQTVSAPAFGGYFTRRNELITSKEMGTSSTANFMKASRLKTIFMLIDDSQLMARKPEAKIPVRAGDDQVRWPTRTQFLHRMDWESITPPRRI